MLSKAQEASIIF